MILSLIFALSFSLADSPREIDLVKEQLEGCGLERGAYSVQYSDLLQSTEVLIDATEGGERFFDCIEEIKPLPWIEFSDASAAEAYSTHKDRKWKLEGSAILSKDLAESGMLENLPRPSKLPVPSSEVLKLAKYFDVPLAPQESPSGIRVDQIYYDVPESWFEEAFASGRFDDLGNLLIALELWSLDHGVEFQLFGNEATGDD
ncbi:hypothetical protein WJT74_04450 [Sphingomicrobium sp. XHP0239]|uniref:hypothetical protein n=1 Tax=Sphingomicrobium maritimum TaxID=3133972 RepID=UPI0031CC89FB